MEAQVPPEERRVGQSGRGERRPRELLEVVDVPDGPRDAAPRVGAREGVAGALQAGVGAEPERAVRGEPDEQRHLQAQRVEGMRSGVLVGQADVDVKRRLGRPLQEPA
jgi:hypothetical protein